MGLDVVITPQQAKTQAGVTAGEGAKRLSEPEVGEGWSESVTSGCDWCCQPKVKAVYYLLWSGEQLLMVDGFQGKGEPVLSKHVAPGRLIKSQWVSPYGQQDSTNWT